MAYRKAPLPMLQALACAVLGPCAGHVPDGIIWPILRPDSDDWRVAFPSEQAEQQDGHRHDVQDE